MKTPKKWITLNAHGKRCLKAYLSALSSSDLLTSQLDYLNRNGITDYHSQYKDYEKRYPLAGECLTDEGIETAKHYFEKYL